MPSAWPCWRTATWQADHPERRDKSIVSFHLWEAYSPLSSLAGDRLELPPGARGPEARRQEHDAHLAEHHARRARSSPTAAMASNPTRCWCGASPSTAATSGRRVLLTMGVDVQDDRLELLVVGWGPGEESWFVDRAHAPRRHLAAGTVAAARRGARPHVPPRERQSPLIHAACIDSAGHRTTMVYDYAARKAARRVYAIIGRDGQRPARVVAIAATVGPRAAPGAALHRRRRRREGALGLAAERSPRRAAATCTCRWRTGATRSSRRSSRASACSREWYERRARPGLEKDAARATKRSTARSTRWRRCA